MRNYIDAIHLHPRDVHGVEIYNGGNQPSENILAEAYAKAYDFPVTSGSDIHNINFALEEKTQDKMKLGGVAFETPLQNIADFVKRIKSKEGAVIK